ncbi:MAG: YceI family protein [Solirubrobacteraceae bacterium]|nr:YceI family protein [Solirubrobacteraceae bacterium]
MASARAVHRTWSVDAARSDITFTARLLRRIAVRGTFASGPTGTIVQTDDTLSSAVTIAVETVDTDIRRRDRHLRSAEFLDVARHPTITVRVDGIVRRAGVQHATAMLTLKGVTTAVPVEVELFGTDASLTALVRGRLRRRDVQIVPSWLADRVIDEEVELTARITTRSR